MPVDKKLRQYPGTRTDFKDMPARRMVFQAGSDLHCHALIGQEVLTQGFFGPYG